jgi:hypothetical protein
MPLGVFLPYGNPAFLHTPFKAPYTTGAVDRFSAKGEVKIMMIFGKGLEKKLQRNPEVINAFFDDDSIWIC